MKIYFFSPLKSIRTGLRAGGIFVLDFLNARHVRNGLPMREEKEMEGIRFQISKTEDGRFVTKSIRFEDRGRAYSFEERVRLYEQPIWSDFSKRPVWKLRLFMATTLCKHLIYNVVRGSSSWRERWGDQFLRTDAVSAASEPVIKQATCNLPFSPETLPPSSILNRAVLKPAFLSSAS
jgi:hypothetical protein